MLLAFFKVLSFKAYRLELVVLSCFLIFALNVNQIFHYFRLTGKPYKKQKHYYKLRLIGALAGYWSVSIVLKMVATFYGEDVHNIDDDANSDFWSTLLFAITVFVTDVGPCFCSLDRRIIKTMTMQHLEEEVSSESDEESKDSVQGDNDDETPLILRDEDQSSNGN